MATAQMNGAGTHGPPEDGLADALGWFSLGLGAPQVAAPGGVCRAIGVRDDGRSRFWMRVVGVRELAAAAGILRRRRPVGWLWARVAGDAMDLTLLGSALGAERAKRSPRILAAIGNVAAVTVADVVEAVRLSRAPEPAREPTLRGKAAITVQREREAVHRFWHDFEDLPHFSERLGPVELLEDVPRRRIAWRSQAGAGVVVEGVAEFTDAPGDRGTEVHLELRYSPPGGRLGATVAKLLGADPAQQARDDLRRFKQVMETGMVVRSEGSPEGPRTRRLILQRPARPMRASSR
jgi:uncharacterized membrane protein